MKETDESYSLEFNSDSDIRALLEALGPIIETLRQWKGQTLAYGMVAPCTACERKYNPPS